MLYSRSLLAIYFKHSSVYVSIPYSHSIPPRHPSSLLTVNLFSKSGVPNPQHVRNRAAQQEVRGRRVSEASSATPHCLHYCLNHPPPPLPPPSGEKLSSSKLVPGAKKIGDRCSKSVNMFLFCSFHLFVRFFIQVIYDICLSLTYFT